MNHERGVHGALDANPDCFGARLAIALAPKKPTQRSNQANHLIERDWCLRAGLLREQVRPSYLVSVEEQRRVQLRAGKLWDMVDDVDPDGYCVPDN